MMPVIRIGEDVFRGLQSLAQPFTDTPETVIRRLLEEKGVLPTLIEATERGSKTEKLVRAPNPTRQPIYEQFVLHLLATQFNGKGHKHEVTKAVEAMMRSRGFLGASDMQRVSSGETRAENTIAWARNALKDRGLISRTSRRGLWELTPKGLKEGLATIPPSKPEA